MIDEPSKASCSITVDPVAQQQRGAGVFHYGGPGARPGRADRFDRLPGVLVAVPADRRQRDDHIARIAAGVGDPQVVAEVAVEPAARAFDQPRVAAERPAAAQRHAARALPGAAASSAKRAGG
ncbi:MAG: hypothetical protein U5L06_00570, partial [Rhodovibrio sp.]|nr:hypothetical protein [Rhodovibrio sp.]